MKLLIGLLAIFGLPSQGQAGFFDIRDVPASITFPAPDMLPDLTGFQEVGFQFEEIQTLMFDPYELYSQADVSVNSHRLKYVGPGGNLFFTYGPYHDIYKEQQAFKIEAFITFATSPEFSPTKYSTCRKRNWTKKCVSWNFHENNHGYTIDLTAENGTRSLMSQTVSRDLGNLTDPVIFRNKETDKESLKTVSLVFHPQQGEDLTNLEVRISNIFGVHQVVLRVESVVIKTTFRNMNP